MLHHIRLSTKHPCIEKTVPTSSLFTNLMQFPW